MALLAVERVLAVLCFREFARHSLLFPDLPSSPLRMTSKMLIPFLEVLIDRPPGSLHGRIIAVVKDGSGHATEDRLDDIQKLCTGRQGSGFKDRKALFYGLAIQLVQVSEQLLGDVQR